MKVTTDIIASIAASLIGQSVILVIIYIETFKTNVIVFIGNVIICLKSRSPIIFSITIISLILLILLCEITEKKSKLLIKIYIYYHR